MSSNNQYKWLQQDIPAYDFHNPGGVVDTVRIYRREYNVVYVFVVFDPIVWVAGPREPYIGSYAGWVLYPLTERSGCLVHTSGSVNL